MLVEINKKQKIELNDNLISILELNYIDKKEKTINIDEQSFDFIKDTFDKEDIIAALSYEIAIAHNISIPLKKISINDAIDSQKNLISLNTQIKNGLFYTRYEDSKLLSNYYFDESNTYNDASNFFHQYNRFCCDSINSPSPYRVFNNYKFAHSMCGAVFSLKLKKIGMQELFSCLAMRKYVASQFKPSIAKAIYDYYQAENIVDLCAGWGDRLSGFYASKYGKNYFGIDANKSLFDNYERQIETYNNIIKNKKATIIYGSTEDDSIILPSNVDFIFTSPPYFGIEKYSKDDKQSFIRYKKLDDWLINFLFKLISKSYASLVSGGRLALNISDVYMNHKVNNICHPMIDFAINSGFILEDIHGIKMSKRTNSKSDKAGIFCEPLYVFIKK